MAAGPIALLAHDDLKFIPEPPIFQTLVAQTLGANLSDADGFDALSSETASLLASSQSVVDAMGGDLAEASDALAAPELDSGAQLVADLSSATAAGDAILNDYVSNEGGSAGTVDGGGPVTNPAPVAPPADTCTDPPNAQDELEACGRQPQGGDPKYTYYDSQLGETVFNQDQFDADTAAWQQCIHNLWAERGCNNPNV